MIAKSRKEQESTLNMYTALEKLIKVLAHDNCSTSVVEATLKASKSGRFLLFPPS